LLYKSMFVRTFPSLRLIVGGARRARRATGARRGSGA
jgi:hypothetical protein